MGLVLPGKIKKSKKLAEIIVEKFSSIVPNSLEELTSLRGWKKNSKHCSS